MPLPETIAVRYTEEEAGYVSVRPVVRQTFRRAELLGLLLAVAGKDLPRVQNLLRRGSVTFHAHRYWWTAIQADEAELAVALAAFPDADPARPFVARECAAVLLEESRPVPRILAEIAREAASRRGLLRRGSVWDALIQPAGRRPPAYRDYSYEKRADAFVLELTPQQREELRLLVQQRAPRRWAAWAGLVARAARLVYLVPRT